MATINSWNNQIASANSAITLNAGTNSISIGSDASSNTISIGTGGTSKNINIGSISNTGNTNIFADTGNISISKAGNSGSIGLGNDTQAYNINIADDGSKNIIIGSFNESTLAVYSASITMDANIIDISNVPNAAVLTFGSGSGSKTVTVGSTNTTSSLTLNSGSGGIKANGVASLSVANKNYVTINTSTGALGSDSGPSSSISITGNSGGALVGSSFTFTGGSTGLSFAGAGSTETLTGTLVVSNGGTGNTTFTAYAPVVAGTTSTGAFQSASTGLSTSGFILTSNGSSAVPSFQAPSYTGIPFTVITSDQTAAINNGYICNKAGTLALALPATAAVGSIIEVTGINTATGWQITQASGQQIFFGTTNTTSGATGTLTSSAIRDSIRIVCITANTTWQVLSSVGNITVV